MESALDTQELTPEQQRLVAALKSDVAPLIENNAALRLFCSEHTYVRYLRARQWNLPKAIKMLHATLQWRMEYRPELIHYDDVREEGLTGKNQVYPVPDKLGRPIVLMRPRCENTKTHDRQTKFLIYLLEQASRAADERGVGKICYLLDFEGYTSANAAPLRVSLNCNHILQHHYPERMGVAVCFHAPALFSFTWTAAKPFIDPVTAKKIVFANKGAKNTDEVMNALFHMDKMEACLGGGVQGVTFDLARFEDDCRRYDSLVEAELRTMEAALKEKSAAPVHESKGADLDVEVAPPPASSSDKRLEVVAVAR